MPNQSNKAKKQQQNKQLTDVIDCSRAEFAIEFLSPQLLEVVDDKRPEMQDIISRETVPLLHHHNFCTKKLSLNGSAQATGTCSDNQDLEHNKEKNKSQNFVLQYFINMLIRVNIMIIVNTLSVVMLTIFSTYLTVSAGLAMIVAFMTRPFIKFTPYCLCFPRPEF